MSLDVMVRSLRSLDFYDLLALTLSSIAHTVFIVIEGS